MCTPDTFLLILAVLFPPIGVWVKRGLCSADSLINILLCMLGYLPGLLHAWYIILKYPDLLDPGRDADAEAGTGTVTYYYVRHQPASEQRGGRGQHQSHPPQRQQQGAMNYGTTSSSGPSMPEPQVPPSYEQAVKGDHKVQT